MTNKELSRRIFDDIYSRGRLEEIEATHDQHCRLRDPTRETILEGPEAIRRYVEGLRTGFPDFRIEVDRQVAENDLVLSQVVCRGTHDGPFMGMEPTHREVNLRVAIAQRFRKSKVVEAEVYWDVLTFLDQVGMAPAHSIHQELAAAVKGGGGFRA